jgi:hypothetical protein
VSGNSEPEKPLASTCLADLWSSSLLLTAVCAGAGLLSAVVGYAHSGWMGILAAFLAVAVCWTGAIGSLVIAGLFRAVSQTVPGVLLGMPIRMGVPLMACLVLIRQGSRLLDAGIVAMILLTYFVTLIADTWLLLRCRAGQAGVQTITRVS